MSPLDLSDWNLREIKSEPISESELDCLHEVTGSYEALFSKRSTQIRERGIDVKSLSEDDFRTLLLDHYSFLKRPVFVTDNRIFVGNSKETLHELSEYFQRKQKKI